MLTPRENMIRTICCEEAEWIPITVYVDPYNHPVPDSLPKHLAELFKQKAKDWSKRWELFIPLSEYLGVNEYMLIASPDYKIVYDGVDIKIKQEKDTQIKILKTSAGELQQITNKNFITKHYIEGPEDLEKFIAFVHSWRIEPDYQNIAEIKRMKNLIKDNGIICGFYNGGTPLGMMYRSFANIESLLYMTVDIPDKLSDLFDIMEAKYMDMFEFTLKNSPGVDVLIGMDDTSTTIVSPAMFDKYNVALTSKRAELAHKYGKFYMHHSCGLIHNLLPIYRKTKMDGVHAFTTPPIGDVIYSEGRKLLGDKISIAGNFQDGLNLPDKDTHTKHVKEHMVDAKNAGHIMMSLMTPDYRHGVDFLKRGLEEARKHQKY